MLRLAQPRRALCLQQAIVSRCYSAPAEGQGHGQAKAPERPRKHRPRNKKPVNLVANSDYEGPLKLPAEGSLASELLRETDSGKVTARQINELAADLAAKRRAARLAREAEQKDLVSDAPVQFPRPDRAPRTLTPKLDLEQLAGGVQQPNGTRGDRRGPRGEPSAGDRRRPRDGSRALNGRARKPAPRVLTQNRPPTTIEAAEQSLSAAEEADLVIELDLPSQPGPAPVSLNLAEIFPKPKPQTALPAVNDEKPNEVKVAKALRTLAGDYSVYAPAPSKDLYTTPINQLPIGSQVAMAVARNKGMHINQRKRFADVVRKAVGEVRA